MNAKAVPKPISRPLSWAFVGACLSGISVALFTNDFACSAISGATVGGLGTLVVACLARPLVGVRPYAMRVVLALTVLAIAGGQTFYIAVSLPRDAFVEAFGVGPSSDISGVKVVRYYAGGPGDSVTFIRFKADRAAFERLVAHRGLTADDRVLADVRAGSMSWEHVWSMHSLFAVQRNLAWWPSAASIQKPQFYSRRVTEAPTGPFRSTTILRDEATGDVFVISSVG